MDNLHSPVTAHPRSPALHHLSERRAFILSVRGPKEARRHEAKACCFIKRYINFLQNHFIQNMQCSDVGVRHMSKLSLRLCQARCRSPKSARFAYYLQCIISYHPGSQVVPAQPWRRRRRRGGQRRWGCSPTWALKCRRRNQLSSCPPSWCGRGLSFPCWRLCTWAIICSASQRDTL